MLELNALYKKLKRSGDYYTAGFFKEDTTYCKRYFNAILECFNNLQLPEYENTYLYPLGKRTFYGTKQGILTFNYAYPFTFKKENLDNTKLTKEEKNYLLEFDKKTYKGGSAIEKRFALSGRGYTHFVPDYEFFIKHGLNYFVNYVKKYKQIHNTQYSSLLYDLALAVKSIVKKIIKKLSTYPKTERLEKIILEYKNFLNKKATNAFGAMVRINFIYTLDGGDNPGRLDAYLKHFELQDNTVEVLREFFVDMKTVGSWNVYLQENNQFTKACLLASRGISKPNLCLAVDENIPQDIWQQALLNLKSGGNPALYNHKAFVDGLVKRGVIRKDAKKVAFGGCTETLIDGMTNDGSTDGGVNTVQVLADLLMERDDFSSYKELLLAYKEKLAQYIYLVQDQLNENSLLRSKHEFQLIRSLLCRGCVETGKDFNDGGAVYNFSTFNICSLANTADSLYAIKTLVYKNKEFTLKEVCKYLKDNFENADHYLQRLKSLDFYGNDNAKVDLIAKEIFDYACEKIESRPLLRGENGKFFPACIMFCCVSEIGAMTTATPDGRKAFTDISDSGGAMTGRDKVSPTALLNSVGRINPSKALATWVTNLRLSVKSLSGSVGKNAFKSLVLTYFENGGNQLQVSVVDKKQLIKALQDDDLAKTIVVRVGGFSARFYDLSREVKQNIINRTEY